MLSYLVAALIAAFGLYVGIIIASKTKGELVAGEKYFIYLSKVLLFAILFSFAFSLGLYGIIIAVVAIILALFVKSLIILYIIFATVFYFSSNQALQASLIFILGLVLGSLIFIKHKSVKTSISKAFLPSVLFLLISLILSLGKVL